MKILTKITSLNFGALVLLPRLGEFDDFEVPRGFFLRVISGYFFSLLHKHFVLYILVMMTFTNNKLNFAQFYIVDILNIYQRCQKIKISNSFFQKTSIQALTDCEEVKHLVTHIERTQKPCQAVPPEILPIAQRLTSSKTLPTTTKIMSVQVNVIGKIAWIFS